MNVYWITQLEYLLRIFAAGMCGGIIGYERKSRLKDAGVRTHFIIAMASALMMVISKYGFLDMLGSEFIKFDPSRLASGIVSGVGFIGAGIIFVRNQTVSGITTASGVWATVGLGMAFGSGMYFLGICSTILILLVQFFLHHDRGFLRIPSSEQLYFLVENDQKAISKLQNTLEQNDIRILSIQIEQTASNDVAIDISVKMPSKFDNNTIINLFKENSAIKSIKL